MDHPYQRLAVFKDFPESGYNHRSSITFGREQVLNIIITTVPGAQDTETATRLLVSCLRCAELIIYPEDVEALEMGLPRISTWLHEHTAVISVRVEKLTPWIPARFRR